jgi:hypothetical protein
MLIKYCNLEYPSLTQVPWLLLIKPPTRTVVVLMLSFFVVSELLYSFVLIN